MLEVFICVGSSCHLKGSYDIVRLFQEFVKEYNLQDYVELKASFCLGQCTNGVSTKIGDELLCGVTAANARDVFTQKILSRFIDEHNPV
ncbi:hypothetical protein OXPF_02220 [Oxobacter pfennigii]|uniref:Respiratory-chain NADH dehydrogenase 24 Kd subunit n=1 Tax=Oxobacter pfennigii TaxID=36849 RepID=A0A0N8NTY3_9CLOT|nr:(2Fe-2S) ferredoxin domain-containing protein [Oxobacter pfennigii]KPU46112.1 hypothetical protein OXPF_02220 [Oxobacter pfennigii]